jgi:hypothetical protein
MRGTLLLLRLSMKRAWPMLLATGLLLAAVQVWRVNIAAMVYSNGQFGQITALLPPVIRTIIGPALASIMTFSGIVCGVYFDTVFIVALVALAITLATLPASEVETGFADLFLARPMPRRCLITRTIVLVVFSVLLMLLMIAGGTLAGLMLFAPPGVSWPPARQIAELSFCLGLLVLSWSGVAMAFGAGCRRGVAATITSLVAFAAMILDWAHRLWPAIGLIARLSPFYYFQPYGLVAGEPLRLKDLLVLLAITLSGYVVAYVTISRRDISR